MVSKAMSATDQPTHQRTREQILERLIARVDRLLERAGQTSASFTRWRLAVFVAGVVCSVIPYKLQWYHLGNAAMGLFLVIFLIVAQYHSRLESTGTGFTPRFRRRPGFPVLCQYSLSRWFWPPAPWYWPWPLHWPACPATGPFHSAPMRSSTCSSPDRPLQSLAGRSRCIMSWRGWVPYSGILSAGPTP